MTLARYYRWLSWFQRATSWIGRGGGYRSFTVHRLLRSDDPAVASADVVHERILAAIGPQRAPVVVDAGCGPGGTIFYLQRRLGGQYHGLTLSATQRDRAAREARRRGVAADCRFHVRSYDDDLRDLVPDGADVIVAIESLAHSPAPMRSIDRLARLLRPGGRLVIVDDMPDDGLARHDGDFVAFREGWQCPVVAGRAAVITALAGAGVIIDADVDLTQLVARRPDQAIHRLLRSSRRWRVLVGWLGAGELIDSLYGGLMLERLYARGLMRYRLVAGRRTVASG